MSISRREMRKVDLSQQISLKIIHGFPIAPEEQYEAESLGIDVRAMEIALGVDCDGTEEEDY